MEKGPLLEDVREPIAKVMHPTIDRALVDHGIIRISFGEGKPGL